VRPYGAGLGGLALSEVEKCFSQVSKAGQLSMREAMAVPKHMIHVEQVEPESLDKADRAVVSSTYDENARSGRESQGGDRSSGIPGGARGRPEGESAEGSSGADRTGSGSRETIPRAGDGAGAAGASSGQTAAERVEVCQGCPCCSCAVCVHLVEEHDLGGCCDADCSCVAIGWRRVGGVAVGDPEAERAAESQPEPLRGTQGPEPDPELDRRAWRWLLRESRMIIQATPKQVNRAIMDLTGISSKVILISKTSRPVLGL